MKKYNESKAIIFLAIAVFSINSQAGLDPFGDGEAAAAVLNGTQNETFEESLDRRKKTSEAKALEEINSAIGQFKTLAENGNAEAQNGLGMLYYKGDKVPRDFVKAMFWFRKAADQGYAEAQNNLGLIFQSGLGTPQNYAKALEWYLKAADQGNLNAIINVGFMHGRGLGVPIDQTKSVAWFLKAAKLGSADADNEVAKFVIYFDKVKVDNQIGYLPVAQFYAQNVQQGKSNEIGLLGIMYFKGLGVKKDIVIAHMLFNLGATMGDYLSSVNLNKISAKLTPTQLQEAQDLASSWSIGTPLPTKSKSGYIEVSPRKKTGVIQLP